MAQYKNKVIETGDFEHEMRLLKEEIMTSERLLKKPLIDYIDKMINRLEWTKKEELEVYDIFYTIKAENIS